MLFIALNLVYNGNNNMNPNRKGRNVLKKVLFVASECVPFIKTGGLADVVGSLPKYFNNEEIDERVMIHKYM